MSTVVCTAGRSYYVVRGDGRIYRCMFNPQVIGHINDRHVPQLADGKCAWKESHTGLDATCHPSGDLMFCTWWEADGTRHEAPGCWWSEAQEPTKAKGDAAYLMFMPVNSRCNLACAYCCNFYFECEDGTVIGRPRDHRSNIPLHELQAFADRCAQRFGWMHWAMLGGEPTLYPWLPELTADILRRGWEVGICSNMQLTKVFERVVRLMPGGSHTRLKVSASLHPAARGFNWQHYLSSVAVCRSAQIEVRASLVSWPEQTYAYDRYADILQTLGVRLWLKGCGGYDTQPDHPFVRSRGGFRETFDELRSLGWMPEAGQKPDHPPR